MPEAEPPAYLQLIFGALSLMAITGERQSDFAEWKEGGMV